MLIVAILALPLAMTLASAFLPRRAAASGTVVVGVVSFALALLLVPEVLRGTIHVAGYLRADAISMVFVLATSFLYALCSIYSVGYFSHRTRAVRAAGVGTAEPFNRYSRLFYLGFNAFAWSMLCAPLVDGFAVLWVAIEITTVVSALLVALDRTDHATEAAWKYVLIASSGLGIALFATILLYYAGAQTIGNSYDLAFEPLLHAAHHLPVVPVQLAFVLAVVGFGTKVGLFPVHTWLPDAHAEAPTPISVLLSGALLATSFYAIIRYFQVAVAAIGPQLPRTVMLVFGVLSVLLAALYLFGQRNIKRMLAYSSVEHMGILAIALSFGAPIAMIGMLLHVLAHAAAKGAAFMGAGVLTQAFGTKELDGMREAMGRLRWTAPLFLIAIFTLCALPPFGVFRSEFDIVAGGIFSGSGIAAAVCVVLVTIAFFGLALTTTRILFEPSSKEWSPTRREPSGWMVLPMAIALSAVLLIGVHPPADLVDLLHQGAAEMSELP
ncbi:proton-conducting transporter membrane subunit [Microbacterium sp. STN6]|uniref:proton-conducting transporter transmembrane domain-containing protein n=1 Tax=Microbacterium sp. STN6 TaxID=2995588 RepID=UPI002260BF25|nr:proton-conducting transporter membrane subunit [Microbacterium sp. STN6]MCX7520870.1 proton-conducting transporter membrane subunit [Microbacterium sp. STN6]